MPDTRRPNTSAADPDEQLDHFREAVDLLGGPKAWGEAIDPPVSKRHASRLYSGASPLHDGILEDTARALIATADRARELERRLSPAFRANLTEDQRDPNMKGRANRGRRAETGGEAHG